MVNLAPLTRSALPNALAPLANAGRRTAPAANHTLTLTGDGGLWLVETGSFDVFAVERDGQGRWGLRHHLASISAPGALAGFAAPPAAPEEDDQGQSIDIIAVSRGATVSRLELASVGARPPVALLLPPLARLVDDWIEAITAGLARHFAPRAAEAAPLQAGAELCPPADSLALTTRGVVWALITGGSGLYMGLEPQPAQALVPLTPESWLSRQDGLRLSGSTTEDLMREPGWGARIQAFHTIYRTCLSHALDLQREVEASRMAKRAAKVADALDGTLGKCARLVGEYTSATVSGDLDDALAAACAAACKPLGMTIEDTPLLNRRRTDDRPLTVEEVARVARLRVRQVALRGDWWTQDLGPLVAFSAEDGRPLALVPVKPGRYTINDPMKAAVVPLTPGGAAALSPLAWSFYAPLPDGKVTPFGLLKLGLKNQNRDIAAALAAGALGGVLGLAVPVATGAVFQHIIPGHHTSQLIQVALALIMAAAATAIFRITGDIALLRIEGRIAGRLQAGVIDRLLRLPSSFFNSYSTGDLAQRTLTVEAVRKALTGLVLSSVLAGVFSLFSFALLFYYQPLAALAAGLLFLLVLGASAWTGATQLRTLFEGEAISGNINALVLQLITGIQKLRMAGAEDRAFVLWGRNFAEMRSRAARSRTVGNVYTTFMAGYDVLSLGVVFLAVTLAGGKDFETGQFLAFVAAFSGFMTSIGGVSRAVIQCFTVTPLISRAKPLLEAVPETDHTKADPGRLTGDIEVNNLYFRYDRDSPRVLNGLSLQVKPGQFIALVGPSGCGKSTLMKLLLGFERPESGGLFFDGHDLRTLDVQAVRRQIGVVLQSGRVMPGTIYENIKGAADATVDDAWEAARMAGLDGDIKSMPMAMHTVLTEGSAALSGGQVQRLLIARALVAKPRILLFDEATSALDNRTQAVVTESLARLSVTRIAIAHRLSTVRDADRIFVLNEGKVAEAGDFDELMARDGLFTELARRQLT